MIGKTQFKIRGFNLEKSFNNLSKSVKIYDFHKLQPDISIFKVLYLQNRYNGITVSRQIGTFACKDTDL